MDQVKVNLGEARKNLSELANSACYGNRTFVIARRGRELAVLVGIDEYRRLKELDRERRDRDFDLLLTPGPSELSEEEAREIAVRVVRETRARRRKPQEP